LFVFLGDAQSCLAEGKADSRLAEGQQIYRTATRSDGTEVRAVVQMDVSLPGKAAACSNCHRRSGIGISEGGSRSRNLTAPVLFAATDKPPLRPAYDDATLARAIIAGVAADGHPLDVAMPRYELDADDTAALVAYLHSLGASAAPGVSNTDLHIATVIADNAPQEERAAVHAVMQRYVEIKNAGSRREVERAAAADRHYYGRSRQRAHRNWTLHEWLLKGPESTWLKQLNALNAGSKPFAIVSGTAGSGLQLLQQFCENNEIPCVLPLGNMPPTDGPGFYSLYFSSGVELEAAVTARHIATSMLATNSRILVVGDKTVTGQAALDTLQSQLAARDYKNIRTVAVRPNKPLTKRKWHSLLKAGNIDVLISWIPVSMMSNLVTEQSDPSIVPDRIYTTQSFSDWSANAVPHKLLRSRIHHIYPYSLPQAGLTQFPREDIWLKLQGLTKLDSVAAAKVLFACRALGMGLADIQSNFSREYFLEALEHALDDTQLTSLFPRTTLGPDQRFLSNGAYVVQLSDTPENVFTDALWIQP